MIWDRSYDNFKENKINKKHYIENLFIDASQI